MKLRSLAVFSTLLTALVCASGVAGALADDRKSPELDQAEKACEAKGGKMLVRGLSPFPVCSIPFADGGKICSNTSDCEGGCLLDMSDSNLATGTPATGKCAAWNVTFGCMANIDNGRVSTNYLCRD